MQEIDHLLTYVRDLDAAAFRRMGFTLSPISKNEQMGVINHLVLMRPATPDFGNFIELMSWYDRRRLPPVMAEVLSGDEGLKSIVLGTKDAVAARDAMRKQGFDATLPVHVRREWVIGPSQSVFPEFDVILPLGAPLTFNCCRYFNVDLYLRPEWLDHPNGAQRLSAVLAVANNPGVAVQKFAALFESPMTEVDGVIWTSPGHVRLEVMSPASAQQRFGVAMDTPSGGAAYLGYLIEVSSLNVLGKTLVAGGVSHRAHGDAICVDPVDGFGSLIVFKEQNIR